MSIVAELFKLLFIVHALDYSVLFRSLTRGQGCIDRHRQASPPPLHGLRSIGVHSALAL